MAKKQDLLMPQRAKLLNALVCLFIPACVAFLILLPAAYFEAQAFNRLTTGPKVTTWDAVFLDLRIEASKLCQ